MHFVRADDHKPVIGMPIKMFLGTFSIFDEYMENSQQSIKEEKRWPILATEVLNEQVLARISNKNYLTVLNICSNHIT